MTSQPGPCSVPQASFMTSGASNKHEVSVRTLRASLLLCRKALTRYQMLFRHMFYCKHVERQLCNVWVSNKTAKQGSLHSAKWYALPALKGASLQQDGLALHTLKKAM